MDFKIVFFIIFAFILVIFLRLYALHISPPGFYKDEAGMTVNGYSILHTNRDEFGRKLPLFFENFGDFKEPIFIYSQLPSLIIFGYDIYATRFTSAMWGIATIIVFAYLLYLFFDRKYLIVIGIILLGLMPWHFHFSRIGFQLITLPLFVVLYLIIFYRMIYSKRYILWQLLSGLILGLMFYTYYAGRFWGGFWLMLQLFLLKKIKIKYRLLSIIAYLVILIPAVIWNEYYPQTFYSRFNTVSIMSRYHKLNQLFQVYIIGYIQHFSPKFLFITGDTNLRHSVQFHYPLLWTTGILMILGLIVLWQKRKKIFYKMLIISILTFPIISAITTDAPHVHRIIQIVPIFAFIMVLGFDYLYNKIFSLIKYQYLQKLFIGIFAMLFFLEFGVFYKYYLTIYPDKSRIWFQVDDINAINHLLNYPLPHYVSSKVGEFRQSSYQLLRKLDPKIIQSKSGRVFFVNIDKIKFAPTGYYVLGYNECDWFGDKYQAEKIEQIDQFCIYKK